MDLDQNQLLTMVLASVSDETKSQRVAEILAATKRYEDARVAAEAQHALNDQQLERAQKLRDEARIQQNMAVDRSRMLDEREATLSRLNEEMNAEKQRFIEAKDLVERQHSEAAAGIEAKEKELAGWEASLRSRENAVGAREAQAKVMADAAATIINRAKALMADLG